VENEMLREENDMFKQAQNNALCPRCTNDPGFLQILKELEQVKAQNQMLQQELQQVQHVTRYLK
jgi:homeobox-leucine zipper protein